MSRKPLPMTLAEARRRVIAASRLDAALDAPAFGAGPAAVKAATEQLGYVQIDTINVIERSHHHILWSRIPAYRRADLAAALSADRTVFEFWAHALAYIPTRDLRFHLAAMAGQSTAPARWFGAVSPQERRAIVARIRRDGPLTIRDIAEEPVEKTHLWASRKPSKQALEAAFFAGQLTVSARAGMVKTYDLIERHFGWTRRPRPAGEARTLAHLLDRALTAQGLVDLDSACYLDAPRKAATAALIEARIRRRQLIPVALEGAARPFWITPEAAARPLAEDGPVHLLSPFDPLVIQRKRLAQLFGHDHRFEAYVPAARRVLGYFALPVLVGDRIAAAIDIKADRADRRLLIRKWTWLGDAGGPRDGDQAAIEAALDRFAAFQFGD